MSNIRIKIIGMPSMKLMMLLQIYDEDDNEVEEEEE
jgi:hypothetical protein